MYVQRLNGAWLSHPFWKTSFLATARDIERLRASGVETVDIDPERSQPPEPALAGTSAGQPGDEAAEAAEAAAAGGGPASAALPGGSLDGADLARQRIRAGGDGNDFASELSRARRICREGRDAVEAMFREVRLGRTVDSSVMEPLAEEIRASVDRHPGALISIARLKTADDYTYLHSVAVSALMSVLARQLGLDEDTCRDAAIGGLLHDLGKAGVPLEILNKPGRLSDEEFARMRAHPQEGERLLRAAGVEREPVLHMVLHHHEKFDGSGYPSGLAGAQIPLLTRMSTVCDVYDAITSNRAYKEAWDPGESLRRMASWKGHFDPQVLKAFIAGLGIYPVGTLVRLSSDRLAVVLEQRPGSLTRPLVRVFFSARTRSQLLHSDLDLSAPGCSESITGLESPREWGFRDLHKLWAP